VTSPENPFDRFDLSPTGDLAELTDALRERAETSPPEDRPAIRAAWEALTLHPARRLELALTAVPDTRAAPGRPPPRVALAATEGALELADLVGLPPLTARLGPPDEPERRLGSPRAILAPRLLSPRPARRP
jgi:hypothetical protein